MIFFWGGEPTNGKWVVWVPVVWNSDPFHKGIHFFWGGEGRVNPKGCNHRTSDDEQGPGCIITCETQGILVPLPFSQHNWIRRMNVYVLGDDVFIPSEVTKPLKGSLNHPKKGHKELPGIHFLFIYFLRIHLYSFIYLFHFGRGREIFFVCGDVFLGGNWDPFLGELCLIVL